MSQPWEIYDALLDGLPGDVVVRAAGQGPRWSRVLNSAGGVGAAWTMDVRSRPALAEGPLEDRPLRDVAALVKSWNLAEAVVDQAERAALWAAPHVSKAAEEVGRRAKDAQERLEPVVHEARHRVVEDYIPRAQRAAVAAQAAAGKDGTLTERAQRVAVAAKSAALEVPVKKQKKHRVLKTLGWLAVAGAAAAGAYVVWRRSQPVEDPWAEEYWADSTEDEASYGISPEDAQA